MAKLTDYQSLIELEKRLPELAADLENDLFEQHLRVEISAKVEAASLDAVMIAHNPMNSLSTPVKVGLVDASFQVAVGPYEILRVETIESALQKIKSVVVESVEAW